MPRGCHDSDAGRSSVRAVLENAFRTELLVAGLPSDTAPCNTHRDIWSACTSRRSPRQRGSYRRRSLPLAAHLDPFDADDAIGPDCAPPDIALGVEREHGLDVVVDRISRDDWTNLVSIMVVSYAI